jgi:hypothetical protein
MCGDDVAQRPAEGDGNTVSGGLHRAPGAERQAAVAAVGHFHGGGQRADRKEPAAEADQQAPTRNSQGEFSGSEKTTAVKAQMPISTPLADSR